MVNGFTKYNEQSVLLLIINKFMISTNLNFNTHLQADIVGSPWRHIGCDYQFVVQPGVLSCVIHSFITRNGKTRIAL